MFADRHSPLNALARPFAGDLEQPFRNTNARRRQSEPAGVQCGERYFQTRALFRNHVFARHMHVGEFHNRVIKRAQSHEPAAIGDFETRRGNIDNERGDLFAFLAVHHLRRCPRHHHEHARLYAIRAPKFFAIENELRTIG